MRSLLFAALCVLLSACATNPARVAFAPDSDTGLVMILSDPTPIAYDLHVMRFNETAGTVNHNPFGGWVLMSARASSAQQLVVSRARPGRYVLQDLAQQNSWAVCFQANTISFDVRPGEVTFLGRFDPRPHLFQLQQLTLQSGRTRLASGSFVHFFDNILPPQLDPADETELSALPPLLLAQAPGITAPIHQAELGRAQFTTGNVLFGDQRACNAAFTGN